MTFEIYLKYIDTTVVVSPNFFFDIKATLLEVFPLPLLHSPHILHSYTKKRQHLVTKQLNNDILYKP